MELYKQACLYRLGLFIPVPENTGMVKNYHPNFVGLLAGFCLPSQWIRRWKLCSSFFSSIIFLGRTAQEDGNRIVLVGLCWQDMTSEYSIGLFWDAFRAWSPGPPNRHRQYTPYKSTHLQAIHTLTHRRVHTTRMRLTTQTCAMD